MNSSVTYRMVEEAIQVYRNLSRLPSVKSGHISRRTIPSHIQVNSVWSQRNIERSEGVKYSRGHVIQLDVTVPSLPREINNEIWHRESPSGRYRALVRKCFDSKRNEKQYIEIWCGEEMLQNFDVESFDRHGKICDQDQFGCLEWSHAETHLLYVAEKKPAKNKSFFDPMKEDDTESDTSITRGNEYTYKESWGEQMTERIHPVLCVLDIEAGSVSLLKNIPDDVSPGQAVWCPGDLGVLCVGWFTDGFRHGLIYCQNRRSALFHVSLEKSSCEVIGVTDKAVRSPVFSPDGSKFVYLESEVFGPHVQCSKLMMCDWSTKGILTVVDIVQSAPAQEFQGIFTEGLVRSCWTNDSKRLIIDVTWRSKDELIVVEVETGVVTRLTNDPKVGSWRVLDVHNDLILAACCSINTPHYLVLGKLPPADEHSSITWTCLDTPPSSEAAAAQFKYQLSSAVSWQIVPVQAPGDESGFREYEYIMVKPAESSPKQTTPDRKSVV